MIEVHSFGFTYPGAQRPAVRGVSFTVEAREIFGFLGPSGAGKSTTQNVLIRLLDGDEGDIRVFDRDLRAWDRDYYRRIGVACEAPNHYLKLSALENLRLFAGLHGGHTQYSLNAQDSSGTNAYPVAALAARHSAAPLTVPERLIDPSRRQPQER